MHCHLKGHKDAWAVCLVNPLSGSTLHLTSKVSGVRQRKILRHTGLERSVNLQVVNFLKFQILVRALPGRCDSADLLWSGRKICYGGLGLARPHPGTSLSQ